MSKPALLLALATLCAAQPLWAAEVFTLTSPAFADGGLLAAKHAGSDKANPNCTGENVAPAFDWANPPADTKSFAFVIYDPQGRNGLGVTHQVAYGIPSSTRQFAEGALNDPTRGFVGGKSSPGTNSYYGPCPPPGSGLHHFVFSIIATDLDPTALEPELTREQLFDRLAGHARAASVVVGRFGQ